MCKYIDYRQLGHHAGNEMVSRCCTRGTYCMQTTKQESEGSTLVLKTMAVVTRRDQKLDYVSLFIGASPHVITTHDTIGESEVSVDLQIGLLSSKKI